MRRFPAIVLLLGAARIAGADDQVPATPPPAAEEAPLPAEEAPPAPPAEEVPPAETPPPAAPVVEPGTFTGRIIDGASKEGLPATYIQLKGGPDGDQTVASELDGTFKLTLAPGTYEV